MDEYLEVSHAAAVEDYPYPLAPAKQAETLAAVVAHWRVILTLAIFGSLVAYVGCQTLTPLYASQASVMIDPREPKPVAISIDPASALPPSEETVRKNEIAIIQSRNLAEAVISHLQLDQVPEFNPALRPPSSLQKAFLNLKDLFFDFGALVGLSGKSPTKTSVSPEERVRDVAVDIFLRRLATISTDASRVIEIRFLSENSERAARIANAVADEYMRQNIERGHMEAQAARQTLQNEIDSLNVNIRDSERLVQKMQSEHGLLPAADLKVLADQMSELSKELVSASGQRAAAEAALDDLKTARASGHIDSVALVLGSPLVQRLQEQATQLAAKIAEMSTTYGESHPKMVQARAELKDYRAKIDVEVAKAVARYQSDVDVARAKETTLRQLVGSAKTRMAHANASEIDIRAAEREIDANKSLMTDLVGRLNSTQAQMNRGPEARIISRATVPRSPSFPPKMAIMAVAFILCGTGGTLLSVLLERHDESIRSTSQLRHMTSARILGDVPAIKRGRFEQSPSARVMAEGRSMFVEKLRGVWFQLDQSRQPRAKTVVITSSVDSEGKSSIAVCLARLLAVGGRKILVVDADLRKPSVHRALGLKLSPGLADLVQADCHLEDVLQLDVPSGAKVITAGAAITSPAEILQSPRMPQILEALSTTFDAVIIDTPPVLPVQDAGIVARHCDMTVMVVRWGATKAMTFIAALQRLQDLNIAVKGVILSRVDLKRYAREQYPDSEMFSRGARKYYTS